MEDREDRQTETPALGSSDPKSGGLTFRVENGKTYFCDTDGRHVFGDFSLKLQGELMSSEEEKRGYWIATCTSITRGNLETKTIVLPANAFDSKAKFVMELRGRFGSGILNLGGGVTASILADYYSSLKDDLISPLPFHKSKRLGYQENGYWLLSRELHIYHKEIVASRDHRFFVDDTNLYQFSTTLDPHLLNEEVLKATCKRFIQLSSNFGCNEIPFLLSTAFIVYSLIKTNLRTHGQDLSDGSSIGLIFSKDRNVGKSLSLKILALGQGIVGSAHPLFCSGGNQTISGVSMKVLMSLLTSTTFTTLLDDPTMTSSLSEFLLQIQSDLPQGSLRTGLLAPSGSILMASNSKEGERIYGRSMRFHFTQDQSFVLENETALNKDLLALVKRNKGFLVAWVIFFFPQKWLHGSRQLISKFREVLHNAVPEQQPRWHKGVAGLLYTLAIFYEVAIETPIPYSVLCHAFTHMIRSGKPDVSSAQDSSFWERLRKELAQAVMSSNAPLKWLNPCVNVAVGGNFVPAVGITYGELAGFTSIGNKETKECLAAKTDNSTTSTMVFALHEQAQMADVRKKAVGLVKKAKGYKIPKSLLGDELVHLIEYKCGLREEAPEAETFFSDKDKDRDEEDVLFSVKDDIEEVYKLLSTRSQQNFLADNEDTETPPEKHTVIDELSPPSKLRYQLMSPGKKETFTKSVLAGIRLASGESERQQQMSCQRTEGDKLNATPFPSSHNSRDKELAKQPLKRKLFVEGSIGLKPRSKKSDRSRTDECCSLCQKATPPSKKGKVTKIVWIQCEHCGQWFHLLCLKMKAAPKGNWFCQSCKPSD